MGLSSLDLAQQPKCSDAAARAGDVQPTLLAPTALYRFENCSFNHSFDYLVVI
jgi:hypothetical protein